jgi:ATP-dependent DNA helicase RecQ
LVRYFGEVDKHDCGMCDVCLRQGGQAKDVRAEVERQLRKGAVGVRQLVQMLASDGYEQVGDVVREMIDRGEVRLDNDALLHWV